MMFETYPTSLMNGSDFLFFYGSDALAGEKKIAVGYFAQPSLGARFQFAIAGGGGRLILNNFMVKLSHDVRASARGIRNTE
jgi:hypothetical protein